MSSWIQGALEKTAGVRAAAYEKATGALAAAQETAGAAATYATTTGEALKTTDVRSLAKDAQEAAAQRAAGAQAGFAQAFQEANARAYTMEGRMRMEAAVAADYLGLLVDRRRTLGQPNTERDQLLNEGIRLALVLEPLQRSDDLEGFVAYNLGIALLENGQDNAARQQLDKAGQLTGDPADLKIEDFWYMEPLERASQ